LGHWAIYPEELCEIPLKAGCQKGGIVLDPFMGSGTTALVALKQNKKFIGIELNKNYIDIAKARIKPFLEQKKL
jgi:site-specific DNA-methyltransferase (adenine-specific)